ncbi:MAG TPA: BadF/BadG/BcrA/BcrD ATPase family protein [Opitutales bacterium]|nr:BadF/BadG/BcrA/BcrD ATPase family protein [Opitutales bacterium]
MTHLSGDLKTYLGIDGGGSKTRALLVDADGGELHYAESGPGNLNAYDETTVRNSLFAVIDQCIRVSGTKPDATCFGLAGAGNKQTRERLESIIRSLDPEKVTIVSDAEIALEGAFTGGPGLLLIAGTGSVCLGKSADGSVHQCGGWGWLADDAGSAGWIGQRALEAAVRQNDGRMQGHAVRDAVFAQLGIKDSYEINAKIYQPLMPRSEIAALSNCVLELAHTGDDAAVQIYQKALGELKRMVQATASGLQGEVSELVLAGGLFDHQPALRKNLKAMLPEFTFKNHAGSPLEGAVALARKIP